MRAFMLQYRAKRKHNRDYMKKLKYKLAKPNRNFIASSTTKGISKKI